MEDFRGDVCVVVFVLFVLILFLMRVGNVISETELLMLVGNFFSIFFTINLDWNNSISPPSVKNFKRSFSNMGHQLFKHKSITVKIIHTNAYFSLCCVRGCMFYVMYMYCCLLFYGFSFKISK